jgi:hypothetical protein
VVSKRKPDPPEATIGIPVEESKRDRENRLRREREAIKRAARGLPPVAEKPIAEKKPLLPQGRKLSATEANQLSPIFGESMESYFQYMDQYLWARQEKAGKSTREAPVWTNIDDEEIAALTRVMMRFGQHNEAAAAVVRGAIELRDYVDVGVVFAPRIQKTVEIIRETHVPKAPRQRKSA